MQLPPEGRHHSRWSATQTDRELRAKSATIRATKPTTATFLALSFLAPVAQSNDFQAALARRRVDHVDRTRQDIATIRNLWGSFLWRRSFHPVQDRLAGTVRALFHALALRVTLVWVSVAVNATDWLLNVGTHAPA